MPIRHRKRDVYHENKYADTDGIKASCMLFEKCGVTVDKYVSSGKKLEILL